MNPNNITTQTNKFRLRDVPLFVWVFLAESCKVLLGLDSDANNP